MSDVRKRSLVTIKKLTGMPVQHLHEGNLNDIVLCEHPLYPAFEYLTPIQRVDYLRAYLMHYYGGGYTDIKPTSQSWVDAYESLVSDRGSWLTGYPEIGRKSVGGVRWQRTWLLQKLLWRLLVGNCPYIMRAGTPFTNAWLERAGQRLDHRMPELR